MRNNIGLQSSDCAIVCSVPGAINNHYAEGIAKITVDGRVPYVVVPKVRKTEKWYLSYAFTRTNLHFFNIALGNESFMQFCGHILVFKSNFNRAGGFSKGNVAPFS